VDFHSDEKTIQTQYRLIEALQESEKKFRALFQDSRDMMHMVDSDGCIIDVNKAEIEALGYSREEMLGMPLMDLISNARQQNTIKHFKQVITGQAVSLYETEWMAKDGSMIPVELSATPRYDHEGNVIGGHCVARDIRERKQAEIALIQSEQKFRTLFQESRDMMHIVGIDGLIIDVNRAELETLGFSREELIGLPVAKIISPENRESSLERIRRLMEGNKVELAELALLAKDGSPVPVEVAATPQFDAAGQVTGGWAVIRDIRERKQREALLARREGQLAVLAEAGREINEQLDEVEIGRRLVNLACRLVDCESGAVGFYRDGKICFREYVKQGEHIAIELDFPSGYGVPGHVLETKMPYISQDAPNDPHVIPEIQQRHGFIRLIDVPILKSDGDLLGCFEMHDRNDGADFDEQDLEMLQSLAGIVAAALVNTR